ncbi:hypothetical protein LLEC1_03978 [Akanthomyces lecanii]|uniref:Uncharacterized protein n=1 Tax=Cordyceps confragosa TaxID=2714763 RepID=A0A179IGA5_CORDF|nr:hypothetical protein LLEC1_03978 [Akanthomyces lecanii]
MKLTPVRVRGKRKATAATSTSSSSPRPSKMRRSIKDVKHTRQLQPRTNLSRLPAEILESILLYSGSVALPRSSPVVGAKLSSRATLLRFFIWGFHDTWDQWFGIPFREVTEGPKPKDEAKGSRTPQEAKYFPCDGDPELQSSLLELPWVDIDFILRAQQAWADTYARHRWYEPPAGIATGGYGVFDAALFFDKEYKQFIRSPGSIYRTVARNVHPGVRLSLPLVTGPWDEERQKRLLWLVRGGINLETRDSAIRSLPWEYHLEFLHNAIVQADTPNSVAYRLLRDQCDLMRVPEDTLRRERDALVKRLQWGQHSDAVFELLQEVLEDVSYKLDYQSFHTQK